MTTKTAETNGSAPPTTDLASIVDVNELKAMAYDRMAAMQQLQGELQMINGRISELSAPAPPLN